MSVSKFTCTFLLLIFSASAIADDLIISNVWIPEAPPGSKVMAGYMNIENKGQKEILIEKVTSPHFKMVEMHRSLQQGSMMAMEWQLHIHVPVGKVTKLEPGGKHLMLMRPAKRFVAGKKIELTLHLSNNQQQTVIATVRKD